MYTTETTTETHIRTLKRLRMIHNDNVKYHEKRKEMSEGAHYRKFVEALDAAIAALEKDV